MNCKFSSLNGKFTFRESKTLECDLIVWVRGNVIDLLLTCTYTVSSSYIKSNNKTNFIEYFVEKYIVESQLISRRAKQCQSSYLV